MKKVVILGCGFVGARTAALFAQAGWDTIGVTRSATSAAALAASPYRVIACDITNPQSLSTARELQGADAVISAVSSGRRGEGTYREVYLNGLQNAITSLTPAHVLFVSSTSVYAQNDGSWVTEESPADPLPATARILREAEDLALAHGGIAARLSGIYGAGRSILLQRFLSKTAFIEGDGSRHINQIHADDAAAALFHLIVHDLPTGIYNVSDGHPLTQLACYQWLAARLSQPLPPSGPVDPHRKRGVTDKRVSNTKLRSLGWTLTYPSFQEAVTRDAALLAGARAGGTGDAQP